MVTKRSPGIYSERVQTGGGRIDSTGYGNRGGYETMSAGPPPQQGGYAGGGGYGTTAGGAPVQQGGTY